MTKDEALKLALEALERLWNDGFEGYPAASHESAITAIKEALAEQPAQQQVIDWKDQYEKQKRRAEMWIAKYEADIGPLEKAGPVTAQQQEPAAWFELLREARDNCKASIVEEGISASRKKYRIDLEARLTAALNTSPPASKPLTDEQIAEIAAQGHQRLLEFARSIESAHGIKEKRNDRPRSN